jgi:hypothetical protein
MTKAELEKLVEHLDTELHFIRNLARYGPGTNDTIRSQIEGVARRARNLVPEELKAP